MKPVKQDDVLVTKQGRQLKVGDILERDLIIGRHTTHALYGAWYASNHSEYIGEGELINKY